MYLSDSPTYPNPHSWCIIINNTLSKISNWSPYIFYASFESKSRLNKIHASINKPRLYVFHLKITGSSCTDDAKVKVPSIQKVTFFFYNMKYSTETLSFVFLFI